MKYVIAGSFDSSEIEPTYSIAEVSDGRHEQSYLVSSRELPTEVRAVQQRGGGIKYVIDQLVNPKTIVFRPGGLGGDRCLISGQLGTVSSDPISVRIFQLFTREVKKKFAKIKSFYVGKEAERLLNSGWRLTTSPKAPRMYDLQRD